MAFIGTQDGRVTRSTPQRGRPSGRRCSTPASGQAAPAGIFTDFGGAWELRAGGHAGELDEQPLLRSRSREREHRRLLPQGRRPRAEGGPDQRGGGGRLRHRPCVLREPQGRKQHRDVLVPATGPVRQCLDPRVDAAPQRRRRHRREPGPAQRPRLCRQHDGDALLVQRHRRRRPLLLHPHRRRDGHQGLPVPGPAQRRPLLRDEQGRARRNRHGLRPPAEVDVGHELQGERAEPFGGPAVARHEPPLRRLA